MTGGPRRRSSSTAGGLVLPAGVRSASSSGRPFIVALVSTFREGPMAAAAIRSAGPLDAVVVFEGPVEGNPPDGPELELAAHPDLHVCRGEWPTDAAKRTAMIEHAHTRWAGRPVWGLWVDGDEILIAGDQLHDWLWRVEQQGSPDNPVGGWPLALVELDGSTSLCMGKLVRVDLVRRYLVSSSLIELVTGEQRAVGNVEYWNPLQGPTQVDPSSGRPHWRARPPLQGEPHLQHRPILRARGRRVERQHAAEARNYAALETDPDA